MSLLLLITKPVSLAVFKFIQSAEELSITPETRLSNMYVFESFKEFNQALIDISSKKFFQNDFKDCQSSSSSRTKPERMVLGSEAKDDL